ncbi:ATP-binding protein [Mucilaginibacter sp. McL0603]|uniref:HAMP domain-containing sensor histidine kinase n=1 Tax=Mucilaginibacter sp. McL0603 TaxID=3415670 RepID=UPI003CF4C8F0
MKIKNRLALYFTLISTVILLIALAIILVIFNSFAKSDFYSRLVDRAKVAAQLYLEADEISPDSLSHVRERNLKQLPGEVTRFYDDRNGASFIRDRQQYWDSNVINMVRKGRQVEFTEGNRQTVGIYYNDNQGNFVILTSAVDIQGHRRINDLIEIMLIMIVWVVAGLFFIGRWFAKKALEPIDDIIGQMQQVRASNLSMRINEGNGKDEISELAQNFNRLLKHLDNAFEVQQTYVVNASHELKTPVTSIIGEIEVALNKKRPNEEYEQILKSVLNDAENLNETITGLMELAQVDMSYTRAELSPVAVDELVWELADHWTNKMGKGLFAVSIQHLPDDPEKLQIPANKSLLIIALNNIISNAYKFSDKQRVQCDLYADSSHISITISDKGLGIPAEELEKVFQSFYRATNAKDYKGNGIGLYITGKIISLFNGTINATSEPGKGTSITVSFIN